MGKKNKKTKKIKKGKPLKNILDKRIKIPKKIRLAIIGIIVIFFGIFILLSRIFFKGLPFFIFLVFLFFFPIISSIRSN
jgi:hypothetical protein